jgi:hypothetical protein
MANLVEVTEDWVVDEVQGYVISLGVTSRNFESAKQVTRDCMFNRAIPNQIRAYRNEKQRQIDYDLRKAPLFSGGAVRRSWEAKFAKVQSDLRSYALTAIDRLFTNLSEEGFGSSAAYWSHIHSENWKPLVAKPLAPSEEMSPKHAEEFVTQLMLFLGATGAKTTKFSQDGGADCIADKFVVQVKHLAKPVGVATVREIFAVGVARGRTPVLFSKSGFTSGALDFAIEHEVLLFTYLPVLKGETATARRTLLIGLGSIPSHPDNAGKRKEKAAKPSNRSPKSDAAFHKYKAR